MAVCVRVCMVTHIHTHLHTQAEDISQEVDLGGAERLEGCACISWKHSRNKLKLCENKNEK